jgi:hypothetical protein
MISSPLREGVTKALNGQIASAPFKQCQHCLLGKRLAGLVAREDEIVLTDRGHLVKNRERCIREWHPVLRLVHHAVTRDDP